MRWWSTALGVALAVGVAPALPASAVAVPVVRFVDLDQGPARGGPGGQGAPITIFGSGFGSRRGTSFVTIGGRRVARYHAWGRRTTDGRLQTIVVQPGPGVRGGQVVVTVGGRRSRQAVRFTVRPGRIHVVAPGGSDGAACTAAAPCATVGHVLQRRAGAGDTVLMRAGAYAEDELWIRGDQGGSGTVARRIAIAPWPGARPLLTSPGRPWIVDADHITVAGIRFEGGKALSIPDAGLPGRRGVRLVGNSFRGRIGFGAVDVHGDGHFVAGNDCQVDGSSVGTQGHCFYVSYGSGVTLRDNTAAGATGYGIHVFDQQRSSSDFRRVIRGLVIEGNLLRGSRERSGLILAMGDEGARGNLIDGVVVRGNTLTGNNHAGMVTGGNVRNVTVRGNRFVQNGRIGLDVADDPTVRSFVVAGNRFVQSQNGACTSNCSWFPLAHVRVGARADGVAVSGNAYGPGAPLVIGARDATGRRLR